MPRLHGDRIAEHRRGYAESVSLLLLLHLLPDPLDLLSVAGVLGEAGGYGKGLGPC